MKNSNKEIYKLLCPECNSELDEKGYCIECGSNINEPEPFWDTI